MKNLIVFILVIMMSHLPTALADCSQPVTLLDVGVPSPCRGYLFTPDKEKELFNINENYKLLQNMDVQKDDQITLYKTQVTDLKLAVTDSEAKSQVWQTKATDATEKYIAAEDGRGKRDMLFLALGVVLTLGAGFAASKFWSK